MKLIDKNLSFNALLEAVNVIGQRLNGDASSEESLMSGADGGNSALSRLCRQFELSPLEQDILVLCAGVEIEPSLVSLCKQVSSNESEDSPFRGVSVEFVSTYLRPDLSPSSRASILGSQSPLFQWNLVQRQNGFRSQTEIRIESWTLEYLMGVESIPLPYRGNLSPLLVEVELQSIPDSYLETAKQLFHLWTRHSAHQTVQLCGSETEAKQQIAAIACQQYGWSLHSIHLDALGIDPTTQRNWIIWWHRRALLSRCVLLVEYGDPSRLDPRQKTLLNDLRKILTTPLLLSGDERLSDPTLPALDITSLTPQEQREIWNEQLGSKKPKEVEDYINTLVLQFNLNASAIHSISNRAVKTLLAEGCTEPEKVNALLWQYCRTQARTSLEGLVERIEPKTTWDELVLSEEATQVLRQIIATARNRSKVYSDWKMGGNSRRGLGITTMFFGPPGTGKTTAAEIIARELGLDLYRVDLSQISDKYIGETEKKLKKVFDEAEVSGAQLLFDEADSLIGKRSDVKDSKDRYANQSVSYLLQRMEAYSGLAILTTNLPNAIDSAFMRRIRFSVRFEYPTMEQRFEIWKRMFPKDTPTQDVSFQRLAQLNVSGAIIRNVALGAAFLAAEEQEQMIRMCHLLQAARTECMKQGRPITDEEIRGWV
jgi:ATP-dependent 26S proteasome regulatory subunit